MKKKMKKSMEPTWIGDLKLFLKDLCYFLRDTINNATHLIVRGIKLITLISVWGKGISKNIEVYLNKLRNLFKMKK